jgi:Protein of unknown function (DUF3306)
MSEGFLSRWSRLKKRTGDSPAHDPAGASNADADSSLKAAGQSDTLANTHGSPTGKFMPWAGINPAYQKAPAEGLPAIDGAASGQVLDPAKRGESSPEERGQATLPDIASLNMASDFKPFMQANVPAESRNAALKKLFADPSFNVMDGLDTYVADYSLPDPIPAEMLKELLKSKALSLFDDPPENDEDAQAIVSANELPDDSADRLDPPPLDHDPLEANPSALNTPELRPSEVEAPGPRVAHPPQP